MSKLSMRSYVSGCSYMSARIDARREKSYKSDLSISEGDEFKKLKWYEKVCFIIYFPFKFLLMITNVPCDEENYQKYLCIVWPFPGLLFIFYAIGLIHWYVYIGIPLAFVLTAVFYYT